MNRSTTSRTFSTNNIAILILSLWLASLSCYSLSRTPTDIEPTPTIKPLKKIAPKDGMEILFVPQGAFIMGSENGDEYERPVHSVYLDDFWIDKTEITNSMYYLCMELGTCDAPLSDGFTAPKDHYKDTTKADHPVVNVTWYDAETYCEWVGRRLPTEAEWEKAARGVNGQIYPWGNQDPTPELLNFDKNNFSLMPVGSFPLGASPYGVMDMAGNAWEWIADWYDDDYYEISPSKNPTGPIEGTRRSMRGGAYFQPAYEVRTTFRGSTPPDYNRSGDMGFRCAMTNVPSTTPSR